MSKYVTGDWLMDGDDDTIAECFPAEINSQWSGGVVPFVTREVADRIVKLQERIVKACMEGEADKLHWEGDVLVMTRFDSYQNRELTDRIYPVSGLYDVGFGWCWDEAREDDDDWRMERTSCGRIFLHERNEQEVYMESNQAELLLSLLEKVEESGEVDVQNYQIDRLRNHLREII